MFYFRFTLLYVVWLSTPLIAPQHLSAQAEPPFELPPSQEMAKLQTAIIFTEKGEMRFQLFPDEAPWHIANLKYLADKGYFKNKIFHIFYPDYIIQGGAESLKNPNSGPTWSLPSEFTERHHKEGTLGMARVPNSANPERRSHAGQFHIILNNAPQLDRNYTIMGEMTYGFDVLEKLGKGDKIKDLRVYVRP